MWAAIREVDPNLLAMARLARSWIDQVTEELWNVVALIVILGVVATLLVGLWLSVAMAAGLRQSLSGSPIRLDTANPLPYCGAALLLVAPAVMALLAQIGRAHV